MGQESRVKSKFIQILYSFCFLTEEAVFVKKFFFREISVRVLRIVYNVEKCDFYLASGCMCVCACVCMCLIFNV